MKRLTYSFATLILLVVGVMTPISASATSTWGPLVDITSPTANAAEMMTVSSPSGELASVWTQTQQIWVAISSDNGTSWNTPVAIPGAVGASSPNMVVSSSGVYTVAWNSGHQNYTSTSSDHGATWSTPVSFPLGGSCSGVLNMVTSSQSTVNAFWTDCSTSPSYYELWTRRSVDSGISWSSPTKISSPGSDSTDAELAVDAQGNLVAMWQGSGSGNVWPMYVSRSINGGLTWSAPSEVSALGTDVSRQKLIGIGSGKFIATWAKYDGTNFEIQVLSSTDSGATWSQPQGISVQGLSSYDPRITTNGTSEITIGWRTLAAPVLIQVSTSSLTATSWTAPLTISQGFDSPGNFHLTTDSNGNTHALWTYTVAQGDEHVGETYSSSPQIVWSNPVDLISNVSGYEHLSLVSNPLGFVTASWLNDGSNTPGQSMTLVSPPYAPVPDPTPAQPTSELANTGVNPDFLFVVTSSFVLIALGIRLKWHRKLKSHIHSN